MYLFIDVHILLTFCSAWLTRHDRHLIMGIKVRNRTLCRAMITCRNALSGLSFVLPAMERDALLKRLANTLNVPQLMIKFLTAVDYNEVLFCGEHP